MADESNSSSGDNSSSSPSLNLSDSSPDEPPAHISTQDDPPSQSDEDDDSADAPLNSEVASSSSSVVAEEQKEVEYKPVFEVVSSSDDTTAEMMKHRRHRHQHHSKSHSNNKSHNSSKINTSSKSRSSSKKKKHKPQAKQKRFLSLRKGKTSSASSSGRNKSPERNARQKVHKLKNQPTQLTDLEKDLECPDVQYSAPPSKDGDEGADDSKEDEDEGVHLEGEMEIRTFHADGEIDCGGGVIAAQPDFIDPPRSRRAEYYNDALEQLENEPILADHMKKKSKKEVLGAHTWQKRFWALDKSKLQAFKRSDAQTVGVEIPLWKIVDIVRHPKKKEGCRFDIVTGDKQRFSLLTADNDICNKWVEKLNSLYPLCVEEKFELYV